MGQQSPVAPVAPRGPVEEGQKVPWLPAQSLRGAGPVVGVPMGKGSRAGGRVLEGCLSPCEVCLCS